MGAQFAGGVRRVSLFGTPGGKRWAAGLVVAAATTTATAEVETQELEVPGRASSSWVLESPALSPW